MVKLVRTVFDRDLWTTRAHIIIPDVFVLAHLIFRRSDATHQEPSAVASLDLWNTWLKRRSSQSNSDVLGIIKKKLRRIFCSTEVQFT